MARLFMRLQSRIWDDEDDFVDLSVEAQRLYAFLGSQSNLNHAGMLPVTLRRWATKAKNLTAPELEKQLYELENARFIILDLDREELLIRTHIRNDGVYKQPRVMGAAVSDAMEITSKKLRAALVEELDSLPLDELSDSPTERGGPSIRQQIEDHVIAIRLALRGSRPPQPPGRLPQQGADQPPPQGVPEGVPHPLTEDLAEGVGQEVPEGVGEGVYARGCASARADAPAHTAPAPSPAPSPVSDPHVAYATVTRIHPDRAEDAPEPLPGFTADAPPRPAPADRFPDFWKIYPLKKGKPSALKAFTKAVADGTDPQAIIEGAVLYALECRGQDPHWIKHPQGWLNDRRWEDEPPRPHIPPTDAPGKSVAPRQSPRRPPADDFGGDAHMARYLARAEARQAAGGGFL